MLEQIVAAVSHCVGLFMADPVKVGVALLSLFLAFSAYLLLANVKQGRARALLIYAHLFFLVLPLSLVLLTMACQLPYFNCDGTRLYGAAIPLSMAGTMLVGLVSLPWLYGRSLGARRAGAELQFIVDALAAGTGMKAPSAYVFDDASPKAFTFSGLRGSRIFLSAGMLEIFTKKELEAVLLHELSHIRSGGALFKLSSSLSRIFSPIALLMPSVGAFEDEEQRADEFAVEKQGTERHLKAAKRKADSFVEEGG
ncbi:MAG: M48 family metalloprotease [Candidatus Burarchaeum sp.]|nr:M48 family metalloprotease [Candidatus Burarchaeum sp.]MDO8339718.1 M48 family metalloprotease [Candidatus Burarchaeum sp.]